MFNNRYLKTNLQYKHFTPLPIGTRFLCPRDTSSLKGVNPAGTPRYRNGTESSFG